MISTFELSMMCGSGYFYWYVPIMKLCSRHTFELFNESTIKVTFFGNWTPRSDIPSVVEKYMNKELKLEKFITHTLHIV
ncbi:hypothetical protein EJD97_005114 [Solanum chilense]|uniref:alcohol dehydrogenase n=1 Tax=Solanum chilense TaxID=4083 RepID=A0A6N2ALP1_SOLCI|nr:hypothetical protein EJD97_005114 [Solanum chilense]